MKKKILLKIALWGSFALLILFAVTVIHVYMVTPKHTQSDQRMRQLSRIDFKQDIDAEEVEKIRGFVGSMEGVENSYFNPENGALVYIYKAGSQTSDNVYNKLMEFGNYKAEKYVVTESEASNGCPVKTDKSSFTYKVSSYVADLFK